MNALALLGAILSILVGAGMTLCWMVFIVAGMPNSSPAQEAALWRFFWGVMAGGIVCAIAAVVLLVFKRPGLAAGVGAVPVGAFVAWFVWALAAPW
jgi:hypothetical protein